MADEFDMLGAQRIVFESELRPSERLLLLAILDGWSRASRKPYPGVKLLAKKTGLARQTVIDAIDSLVLSGLVPEPGTLDENGVRRSGCRFVYDIEKAVHNLDRLNRADRCTNQTGENPDRSSSGKKAVYPARKPSVKKAPSTPKEPMEGTHDGDIAADPTKLTKQMADIAAGYALAASNSGQDR